MIFSIEKNTYRTTFFTHNLFWCLVVLSFFNTFCWRLLFTEIYCSYRLMVPCHKRKGKCSLRRSNFLKKLRVVVVLIDQEFHWFVFFEKARSFGFTHSSLPHCFRIGFTGVDGFFFPFLAGSVGESHMVFLNFVFFSIQVPDVFAVLFDFLQKRFTLRTENSFLFWLVIGREIPKPGLKCFLGMISSYFFTVSFGSYLELS